MRSSVSRVIGIAEMQRFDQISNTLINETARNEELEYLGGEWRDVPLCAIRKRETHLGDAGHSNKHVLQTHDEVDDPRDGSDEVEQRRPNAKPPKEAPVIRIELFGEAIARAEQDCDGPRDAQQRQGLPANYSVNDANDASRKQRLGRGEVALRLLVHQLRENQGGDELHHEREDYGVDDREEAPRLAPVGRVVREEARAEVRLNAREKLKEAFGPAVARVGTRGRRSLGLLILPGGCDGLRLVVLLVGCHRSLSPQYHVSTVGLAGEKLSVALEYRERLPTYSALAARRSIPARAKMATMAASCKCSWTSTRPCRLGGGGVIVFACQRTTDL